MTKKVLLALAFAVVMLPASLRAQDEPDPEPEPVEFADTLWFEDFSDSIAWVNSGWTIDPDSAVYFSTQYHHIEIYGAPSATVETQAIEIPAGSSYSLVCDIDGLSFYADYDLYGGYAIEIYDVDDLESENTVLDEGLIDFTNDFGHRVFSLAAWAGKTVKVVFRFGNDEYGYSVFAVMGVSIRMANEPIFYVPGAGQEGLMAYVENEYHMYAMYLEGDLSDMTYNWTSQIGTITDADNDTMSIVYHETGIDTIFFTASNSYGTFEDTIVLSVVRCEAIVDFPWSEDFEGGYDPCFTFIDNDGDGFNWRNENERVTTHSGNGAMISESYSNDYGRALYPDNWMITPAITMPEDASGYQVCWYAAGQDPNGFDAEHYSVYVSTTGKNVEDFTTVLYEGVTNHDMTQHCRSLEDFAGQTIYIAFRHHEITDMFYLNIDDIFVGNTTGIESAEEANVAIFPNPVCNMLNVEGENVKSVEVIDMNGRVVLTNDRAGKLDMSEVAEGVYMVRVMSLSGITTQKIVKK